MNEREMLTRFIKEVIKENDGIYSWSWFQFWDDFEREMIIENDPNLWREKLLRNDWMINSPDWNVFVVGMYVLSNDGKLIFQEDLKFLVDKKMTIEMFIKNYRGNFEGPIYIQSVHVLSKDGAIYENLEEPEGPFEFLNFHEGRKPDVPEDDKRYGLVPGASRLDKNLMILVNEYRTIFIVNNQCIRTTILLRVQKIEGQLT